MIDCAVPQWSASPYTPIAVSPKFDYVSSSSQATQHMFPTHLAPMLFASASVWSIMRVAGGVAVPPAVFGVATFPATLFLLLSAIMLPL